MNSEFLHVHITDEIGSVSAELMTADSMKALLVFAHGAGANMHHSFMVKISEALMARDIGTLRFNFPFMEGKKGRPDSPAVAERVVEAMINYAREKFPVVHILAGGKSFGGRMTSQLVSKKPIPDLKGLVFFGFPLHPAGRASVDRAKHLSSITIPMLFLQGTRDALADLTLLTGVLEKLPTSSLRLIEGADHGFLIKKSEQIDPLADALNAWYTELF